MPWLRWSEAKVWRNVWKPAQGAPTSSDERLEDPAAEVAGIERGAGFVGEERARSSLDRAGRRGGRGASPQAESGRRTSRRPYLRLRRLDAASDDRAADADLGRRAVELEVEALEGDRLADPQAGRRQELEEQPVALRAPSPGPPRAARG